MSNSKDRNLFQQLSTLFKSGSVVKRKVRSYDTAMATPDKVKSSGVLLFQKSLSPTYATITSNAYNLSERLMRMQDFCLSGDTLIATPDEKGSKRIDEIVEAWNNGEREQLVFSYDHETKMIVAAKVTGAKFIGNKEVVKVILDDGSEIVCTPEHRFMLRDGSYAEAGDLREDVSLMPFNRKLGGRKDAYRYVEMPKGHDKAEHTLVAENIVCRKIAVGECVHHITIAQKQNNLPSNLRVMNIRDHIALHAAVNNARFSDPETGGQARKKMSDLMKSRWEETGDLRTNLPLVSNKLHDAKSQRMIVFNKTYKPGRHNAGRTDQGGLQNANVDKSFTFQHVCNAYVKGTTIIELSKKLDQCVGKVINRIKWAGYSSYEDFVENYKNHKVVRIENTKNVVPVYDIEVAKYENFALAKIDVALGSQGIVFVHNCEMEQTPEIASTLDIVSDETVSVDDKGRALHVYSDNPKIKETVEELFYDTLNVEFNLRSIVRNTVKYGDGFQYIDVHPNYGVVGTFPVPVNEIEREENYDRDDPFATRFRWVSMGNRTLENWEIAHFRLMGNDQFLPYGCSWIEPARKIWRQLMLLEDAMLVYRVSRAPERRVFYVDVANLPANEVEAYMQQQKQALRMNSVIDKDTGRVDLRYSPLSIDEDYVIPVRGGETGTKIDTLAGLQNQGNVEDVAYLQKKLFAALKIPAAYLGYGDALGSKASLAQLDVRFSRSIASIQRIIIAELNKIAVIHLFAHGFKGDDLQNFVLRLSNPSTVAQQQKLELWRAKFEIAGSAPEGMASRNFIRREILMLNNEQIETLDEERYDEKLVDAAIENAGAGEQVVADTGKGGESDEDLFGGGGEKEGASEKEEKPQAGAEKEEKPENASTLPDDNLQLLTSSDVDEDDDFVNKAMLELDSALPIKPNGHLQKALYNNQRQRHNGASSTYSPEVDRMAKTGDLLDDPYDKDFFRELATESKNNVKRVKITSTLRKTLNDMANSKRFREANFDVGTEKRVLTEGIDVQDEIDELNQNMELDIDVDIVL